MKYSGLILCLAAGAFCVAAPAFAQNTHTVSGEPRATLTCSYTNTVIPYLCHPIGVFRGVSTGMPAKQAFDAICRSTPNTDWSVRATSQSPPVQHMTSGLGCNQWPQFATAQMWGFRDTGYPCVKYRNILMVVKRGMVVVYTIGCTELRDRSLLTDAPFSWLNQAPTK